jgi:hypothetical protein
MTRLMHSFTIDSIEDLSFPTDVKYFLSPLGPTKSTGGTDHVGTPVRP